MDNNKNGKWSSGFGFVMAAAGAAVGLGNIWGFPYKIGEGGGLLFIVLYLVFAVIAGYPVLVGELALGRRYGKGAVGTYKRIKPRYKYLGIMGIASCFIVLGFYGYFGGLIMEYAVNYIQNIVDGGLNVSSLVVGGTSTSLSVIWMIAFLGITMLIVLQGVQKGIERCSKIMMPTLILMLIYLMGKSLSLPGAGEALDYLFKFDLSKFTLKTVSLALVQVFFSLSLAQGIMITYGSYLEKKQNIERNAALISVFDTGIAVLAGMVVIPAVFAFGIKPDAGPGLMFDAMPMIFTEMTGGNLVGLLFFLLLLFAAITSAISMLETVASALTEELGIPKKKAALITTGFEIIIAMPVCFDSSLFPAYEYVSQNALMVLGALIMCIICRNSRVGSEIENEIAADGASFRTRKLWRFLIRYVTPILIAFVLLISTGIIRI